MAVFNSQYVFHDEDQRELDAEEQDISRYIAQNTNDDFDLSISKDHRWKIFDQLTRMRRSLLNWYSFKSDSSLLEIGGGFGALTGLFCDVCREVVSAERYKNRAEQIYVRHQNRNNLTVYAGRIEEMPIEKKFDYITLIGSLEYKGNGSKDKKIYSDYLNILKGWLNPGGKLLVAVENRLGVKYLCGAPDRYTGIPFAGINQYPTGSSGYSFSKQELVDIIELAGFQHHKFYYPLPDYRLPQLIYSEDYIPNTSVGERVIPYYTNSASLVAYENDLYDDFVENKVLDVFCNSFLVECSIDSDFCDVVYAAVSTDRGRKEGFATKIHSNDMVSKTPLYAEGKQQLEGIKSNLDYISNNGVSVIETEIFEGTLKMPFVKSSTLSDYLKMIIKTDSNQFLSLFDLLYTEILRSSNHSNQTNSSLYGYDNQIDYGIILEKAFIDMIPINCFFQDGKLVFFDQEFVRENYPAKYILFRAIKYTYFFIKDAEQYVPISNLKAKYGLLHLWEYFEKEEMRFVSLNRKYEEYQSFLARAYVDRDHMLENAKRLL
ncbi:SAM-dependent methyltransferase [Paenibacillus sp. TSA_86.1]|uniref:SAM-dependent methyltransferase n=1 Tax=Paenibacillus sp. TSA_86.1 TaxID=3415649 RepID=UPI0040460908